jgi:crotonobetainyl-CoA:carnitine CoA-transferase CaiB-like acyl-CoA transferase
MIIELQHPEMGPVKQIGSALKFSEGQSPFRFFASGKGQNTDEVLAELGYSPEPIAALRADGVVV